jgi:hypothetical protein
LALRRNVSLFFSHNIKVFNTIFPIRKFRK